MKEIVIDTEYITLSQFLKMADIIQSGGQAKFFIMENEVIVNGEKEDRRGRKLYNNDKIEINMLESFIIKNIESFKKD